MIEALIKFVGVIANTFLGAFMVMIWLGVAHAQEAWIPAPGYFATFFALLALASAYEAITFKFED